MSWDLVFWKGAPTADPARVWKDLSAGREVQFIQPLTVQEVQSGFEEEYGEDMLVEKYDEATTTIMGRGWEGTMEDEAKYFYLTCGWGLAGDDAWLTSIVRSGLRAGCHVFDPQSGCSWDAPDPDWDPAHFDVHAAARRHGGAQ